MQKTNNNQMDIEPQQSNNNQMGLWDPFSRMNNFFREMEGDMFSDFQIDNFFDFGRTFEDFERDIDTTDFFGNHISKTTRVERAIGGDGKPVVKKYTSSKVGGRTKDGRQLSELTEMFHDSEQGKDIHVQERLLDGKGKRIVKTRENGEGKNQQFSNFLDSSRKIENIYKGIEEGDSEWENEWNKYADELQLSKSTS